MLSDNNSMYDIFCNAGYFPIDFDSIDFNGKVKCVDMDGYIVYPTVKNIRNNKKPLRFHASNPDTINNIKHYIDVNNIDVALISDTYVDSHSHLIFKCSCTKLFSASLSNFSSKNKHRCNECTLGRPSHAIPYESVIGLVKKANLIPLFSESDYTNISNGSATVQNNCGYKSILTYQFIEQNKSPVWFHKSNPYTIYNINVFLSATTGGEYECVSHDYGGQDSDLEILHKKCGNTFYTTWGNLNRTPSSKEPNRHGTRCPYCTGLRTQSLHAVVLKQLFLKLRSGSVVEDQSCRNPMTNCILPTDIVNHNEKIAIEIQSWFHDFDDQKIKDKIKKEYWMNRGYTVYTPDIRDYTVLEMAKIFFPFLDKIPDWVQYDFENKLNVDVAQKLLDNGLLVTEVALEMGVSPHRIYDAIYSKRLQYPADYKNKEFIKHKNIYQQATVQTAG